MTLISRKSSKFYGSDMSYKPGNAPYLFRRRSRDRGVTYYLGKIRHKEASGKVACGATGKAIKVACRRVGRAHVRAARQANKVFIFLCTKRGGDGTQGGTLLGRV